MDRSAPDLSSGRLRTQVATDKARVGADILADSVIAGAENVWRSVASVPALTREEIHVWRVLRDAPESVTADLWKLLSPDERGVASRFHLARDRQRFVVSRGFLRNLLGTYVGRPAATLRFEYGSAGKPALAEVGRAEAPYFNVAHSGALMLAAVSSDWAVGVDVESTRPLPDADAVVRRHFSMVEQAALRALSPEETLRGFYTCWTRKEAFIKATGEGLSRRLDSFDVSVGPQAWVETVADNRDDAARWSLRDIPVGAGYAAALAVATGNDFRVRFWQWEFQ